MRSVRDTFLHYLNDNLTGLPVNFVRRDAVNPNNGKLKTGAVNVQFFNDRLSTHISNLQVSIDVIFADELQAVDATQQVIAVLQASAMTPNLDYTNPAAPVATGTNIYWNPFNITFRSIGSELYYHYSCTLVISHHNQ